MSKDNRVEDFDAIVDRLHRQIMSNGGAVQYVISIEKHEKIVEEREGNWYRHTEGGGSENFAYAPSIPKITERRSVVFSQFVSEIDMAAIVKAVNGII